MDLYDGFLKNCMDIKPNLHFKAKGQLVNSASLYLEDLYFRIKKVGHSLQAFVGLSKGVKFHLRDQIFIIFHCVIQVSTKQHISGGFTSWTGCDRVSPQGFFN